MVATPSNLTYGTITGKFYLTQLDSNDVGREPDYAAATGTVTFTPTVNSYKNLAAPAMFLTVPVTAVIDALGDLRDSQGALGVVLVATNNPDLQPRDWTYTVTINITGATPISFPLLVTGGSTIDLAIAAPAATSAGTAVVVSSSDRIAAQLAATQAAQSAAAAAASAASVGGGSGGTGGTPTYPLTGATASTPPVGDNDTSIATTAFVVTAITNALASMGLSGLLQYNAATNTWPGAPASPLPVIWISTNSPTAVRPPAMRVFDVWIQHPDAVG